MPRKLKPAKPLIYVFCEGESEQVYTDFLKKTFGNVVVLKHPADTGLFEEAQSKFKKEPRYRDSIDQTDEIWFFYDVERDDIHKWDERLKIIKQLRKMRRGSGIRVRLLMTTGCIEYWLMLHYKFCAPQISDVAGKNRVMGELIKIVPDYAKGDVGSTWKIAARYPEAVNNARKALSNLQDKGLPCVEDTDERNHWLSTQNVTFSTVFEAIDYLEKLANTG